MRVLSSFVGCFFFFYTCNCRWFEGCLTATDTLVFHRLPRACSVSLNDAEKARLKNSRRCSRRFPPPERENEDAPLFTCQIQLGVKNNAHFLESTSVSVHRRRVAHVKHSSMCWRNEGRAEERGRMWKDRRGPRLKPQTGDRRRRSGGVLMIHFNKKSSSALSKV